MCWFLPDAVFRRVDAAVIRRYTLGRECICSGTIQHSSSVVHHQQQTVSASVLGGSLWTRTKRGKFSLNVLSISSGCDLGGVYVFVYSHASASRYRGDYATIVTWSLCTLCLPACQVIHRRSVAMTTVEFMYFVFTRMPGHRPIEDL